MGGASTEIRPTRRPTSCIEAAHFDPVVDRPHRAPAQAADRGVAPLRARRRPGAAAGRGRPGRRAARRARRRHRRGRRHRRRCRAARRRTVTMRAGPAGPDRRHAVRRGATVAAASEQVGCAVDRRGADGAAVVVTPPPWRPDLTDPADLVEEVPGSSATTAIPSVLPPRAGRPRAHPRAAAAPPGRRALAGAGYVEVLSFPFVGAADSTRSACAADDPRRRRCGWPTRSTPTRRAAPPRCCPACSTRCAATVARRRRDVALFEDGPVFLPHRRAGAGCPSRGVDRRPDRRGARAARRGAARPAAAPRASCWPVTGSRAGWWGRAPGDLGGRRRGRPRRRRARPASSCGSPRGQQRRRGTPAGAPSCVVGDGPRRPRRRAAPAGGRGARRCRRARAPWSSTSTCCRRAGAGARPAVSPYPVAKEDVALVVDAAVPAAEVAAALREGAGELLESVRLFDVYTGEQVGEGKSRWPSRCGSARPTGR